MNAKVFILDVDGVMTTGQFLYSKDGKVMKVFGPDDNDALNMLKPHIEIRFITADKNGLPISHKRIKEDMNFQLDLVGTIERVDWIKDHYDPLEVIYMGDGIFDHFIMKEVGYSIAPANADKTAKENANFVTGNSGGNRAVAEACMHIMQKFFNKNYTDNMP